MTRKTTTGDVGSWIRRLRKSAGMKQADLARQVGVDVSYLSRVENGKSKASDALLRAVARVLNAPELFVYAGKCIPPDMEVLKTLKAPQRMAEESEDDLIPANLPLPDEDPYAGDIPGAFAPEENWYATFDLLGAPPDTVHIPPILRNKILKALATWLDQSGNLVVSRAVEKEAEDSEIRVALLAGHSTGYARGFADGIRDAYWTLRQTLDHHPDWFFRCFLPRESACRMALVHRLLTNVDREPLVVDGETVLLVLQALDKPPKPTVSNSEEPEAS